MNNYYLLIYLKQFLNKNILHGKFLLAISPHKNVLECYIVVKDKKYRLIFSANRDEIALFLDKYRPPKKKNVFNFFKILEEQIIQDVSLATYDRLITIHLENGYNLVFKLFGNNANALLIKDGTIKDAFKDPEKVKGNKAPVPVQPEFGNEVNSHKKPKNQLVSLNPLLPRDLLKPLIEQHNVDTMNPGEVKKFTVEITDAMLNSPYPRVLKDGRITLWNENILSLSTQKTFESANDAICFAYHNAVHLRRLHAKKDRISLFLNRIFKKKKAEYKQLLQADKSLKRAEKYEKYGNLLMTQAHENMPQDVETLQINDIYEDQEALNIPVKNDLTIAENANNYYEKAKASKKSFQKAKQRTPEVKNEIKRVKSLLNELDEIEDLPVLNKWMKKKKKTLQKYGYGTDKNQQASSPFRKYKEGKYEIWIGKNAKSNDKLTALAHKEDIWLHARGVGGSHTVIRMGNRKDYPPKKVILRAASYTAYYSKAKGMETAPVIYTKRKYIHKPKGASPGMVVVDREQVEIVPPLKPS